MKFKCVSKSWFSLISSPLFMKSHFSTSLKECQSYDYQLLFTASNSEMKQCSLSSALHDHELSSHVFDIECPSQNPDASLSIVGIVNGLACLCIGERDLYLWNPVLKISKRLPSPISTLGECLFTYGFGYDESNDDYKVVEMPCVYRNGLVNVYSLRGDSWRRIEEFKGGDRFYTNGKYASGKIFWTLIPLFSLLNPVKLGIFSLDLVTEKFEEVQGPDYKAGSMKLRIGAGEPFFDLRQEIGVLGGRLSLLCNYERRKVDLWVMDEFGVEESWSEVVSVPYDDVHPPKPYIMNQVLCISRNGQIVFEDDSGLIVYDSKSKEFRNIELGGYRSSREVFVYVESFVSPKDP